jgi:hypothetical protein
LTNGGASIHPNPPLFPSWTFIFYELVDFLYRVKKILRNGLKVQVCVWEAIFSLMSPFPLCFLGLKEFGKIGPNVEGRFKFG